MALIKKPENGMKDILPREMQIRDYVIHLIKETYRRYGFTPIETPCVEHIENLCSKQGGDNEKLIFKILKRGEKLDLESAKVDLDVSNSGLRYDLTVPLVRFYANNENQLPTPFKAMQIGNVWRAERAQRGRYRQFMQCDIDILGEPTNLAEIELILATTETLSKLGFRGFQVRINDRCILKAMAEFSGIPKEKYDLVFIILDKMDKIGLEGVEKELLECDIDEDCVKRYLKLFKDFFVMKELSNKDEGANDIDFLAGQLSDALDPDVKMNLKAIIEQVTAAKTADFQLVFDPTLVRGMSYYTGTIFEVSIPEFGGSCGGGGRYDKMIGRFTGKDVPACGFSIGFERIILLLMEQGYQIPEENKKVAYLIEKGVDQEKLSQVLKTVQEERQAGKQVLVVHMNKNKKFQKEQLIKDGYEEFIEIYQNTWKGKE